MEIIEEANRTMKDIQPGSDDDDDEIIDKGKKGKKKSKRKNNKQPEVSNKQLDKEAKKLFNAKLNGDFMKPFPSFYDPKGMEPPLNQKQCDKLEAKISKEVEYAIK